jgi:diguanylate cyclase (GGDEF)-like protein/PAS domain S-box-containing protein
MPKFIHQAQKGVENASHSASAAKRIITIYAVFSSIWILVSDNVVSWLSRDPVVINYMSIAKGWLFVAVTTLLLYGLIRRMQTQAQKMAASELMAQKERANIRQLLDNIVESSSDAIFAKDKEGRYLLFNQETARVLGSSSEQALGKDDRHLFPNQAQMIRSNDLKVMTEDRVITYEETLTTVIGDRTFLATKGPLREVDGRVVGIFGISRDITERKQAEHLLRDSELRMRAVIQAIPDLVWLKDTEGVYLTCNARFEQFFGALEGAIVGKTDYDFVDKDLADFFRKNDQAAMDKGSPSSNEEWVTFASDGHRELLDTTKTPVRNAKDEIIGVLGIGHDMTARHAAANEIEHLAFYDSLTDLPNRRLMLDRLRQALINNARHGRYGALMMIDLDNFKLLNDTMGHAMGDQLLVSVAERLRGNTREGDTVARMGGDEFVVILEGLEGHESAAIQAEQVAAKILANLAEPYFLSMDGNGAGAVKNKYQCTSSIGIAMLKDQSVSADDLMKRADTAMYQAKGAGRNTLRFFDLEMQDMVSKRAAMEVDLRNAIESQQFVLYYQAQVDSTGRITGAEALVRWQHPERGLVAPGEFIPLAEETGLIISLGQWVLESACRQLADWSKQARLSSLTLAINVSARQFGLPNIVEQVLAAVNRAGVPHDRLKLELTESLLLENTDEVINKMVSLKAQGIGFSLDDFGTGYSSLTYLKRLPLDQLKIDMSFVRDVLTDPNDAAIARTIVALGASLGLDVIAEGVESEAQREILAMNGCLAYQGYLFSRPLPLAEFEEFVDRFCGIPRAHP